MDKKYVFILLGVASFFAIIASFFLMRNVESSDAQELNAVNGTCVVNLIDLSKSFAAAITDNNQIINGLRNEDCFALQALNSTISWQARSQWQPPIKVVCSKIQSSSIQSSLLCPPFDWNPKLLGDEQDIDSLLISCMDSVISTSKDINNLSDYTDISGALTMASMIGSRKYRNKYITILSDFQEDLPNHNSQANYKLDRESVIMIHRPGIDERHGVYEYINRIKNWKATLLDNGAKDVQVIQGFAATESAIGTLISTAQKLDNEITVSLSILIDPKKNVVSELRSDDVENNKLTRLVRFCGRYTEDLGSTVIATFAIMGPSGLNLDVLNPVEYKSVLIRERVPGGPVCDIQEFKMRLEEQSMLVYNRVNRITSSSLNTDVSGTLAIMSLTDFKPDKHYIVIISDFDDTDYLQDNFLFEFHPDTHVIMLHLPTHADGSDPNAYIKRITQWKKKLIEAGASEATDIPLYSVTETDFEKVFTE